jgi:hypothetical protein
MIVCQSCGEALREDSRFCDKCGAMLPTPEERGPVYYEPPMAYGVPIPLPTPADLQLIQQVLTLLTPYLKQPDWNTAKNVFDWLADLASLGAAASVARQHLKEWVRALKERRPPPARRLEE